MFYYIPPKVWAWNTNRINILKKYVDHIIVSFPFEVDFYKKYNIEVNYFGNLILDEVNKIKKKVIIALIQLLLFYQEVENKR